MKLKLCIGLIVCLVSPHLSAKNYLVKSPDNRLIITVNVDQSTTWRVQKEDQDILLPSPISLSLNNGLTLGKGANVKKSSIKHITERIAPIVQRKYQMIQDECNEMTLSFSKGYSLVVRVYNEGAAYRWVTRQKGEIIVTEEEATFNFKEDYKIWFPEEESIYTHQERLYSYLSLSEITPDRFCSTGTLVDLPNGRKVFISESDLEDYPGMFLEGYGDYGLKGKFSAYPLETKQTSDRDVRVTKYADFLAKTTGKRAFPWRLLMVSDHDKELVESELVYKLAKPLQIEDPSWITPGKVAWDWWNDLNITGVDFKSGVNTETYKYYIDFAAKYGLDYIILDEGWYHLEDVLKIKKEVDLNAILQYGEQKKVGIILWVTWKALDDKLDEALAQFEQWGVKGIKVDFMQRDDQWMVNYYHKIASKAAEHKLLVDFHGSYKPTGLRRAYPNVITREGVFGLEQNKWIDKEDPEHNVTLPFIRMVSGPMDFTPGAMINATQKDFRAVWSKPMSQGTRCHQLAMYVVYESPLQMLADNPTHYDQEPECMEFLSAVPCVWDDTKILEAKVSDYIVMARKQADTWYLGAMTDWEARDFTIDLGFLDAGEYEVILWRDGENAHRNATDYRKETRTVTDASELTIHLAPGGGWVGIVKKK